MARPTPSQVAGGLWHLNIDDLFGPTGEQTRLGGPGPFVINLSASSAPINIPATPLASYPHAHVYQIQRYEDGRVRYRLRLGAFYKEEDMDPILERVRETYPSALTATAGPDDLFAIETLCAKAEARRRPVAAKVRAADMDEVAIPPVSEARAIIAAATADVGPSKVPQPEDDNSLANLVNSMALLTEQLNRSQPLARASTVAPSIPTLEQAVSATPVSLPPAVEEADVPAALVLNIAPGGAVETHATEQAAPTLIAPVRGPVAPLALSPVSEPGTMATDAAFTLELVSDAPVATPAVTPAAVATAPELSERATPAAAPEETFVLELLEDTPVVTTSASDAPAPVTETESPGIEVAQPLAVAAANTPVPAAAPEVKSTLQPATPRPAPQAPRLPLFAFVRQALRRMPQARSADAVATSAKVARAAPQVPNPAPAAKSVTAHPPRASAPVSTAKPAPFGAPIRTAAAKSAPAQAAAIAPPAPAKPTVQQSKEPANVTPGPEIASTQTVRALTQQELADQSSLRWFVVELATADSEFLPESIPQLDIYSAYRLYTVNTFDQGREVHSLRLGFFGDEIAAKTVAGYVAGYYEKPLVKRISIAERRRFEEHGVEARKDVGATGKYAVIEITDELVVRDSRLQGLRS